MDLKPKKLYSLSDLELKYIMDANAAKALTLSISMVSLKLTMMAMAIKYWLQML